MIKKKPFNEVRDYILEDEKALPDDQQTVWGVKLEHPNDSTKWATKMAAVDESTGRKKKFNDTKFNTIQQNHFVDVVKYVENYEGSEGVIDKTEIETDIVWIYNNCLNDNQRQEIMEFSVSDEVLKEIAKKK